MGLSMAAVKAGFEESLFHALNGINLENVSVSVEQKEVISNIAVLEKDTNFLPALASHWFFSCYPLFLTPGVDQLNRLFSLFRL